MEPSVPGLAKRQSACAAAHEPLWRACTAKERSEVSCAKNRVRAKSRGARRSVDPRKSFFLVYGYGFAPPTGGRSHIHKLKLNFKLMSFPTMMEPLLDGKNLSFDQAKEVMCYLTSGEASDAQIGAVCTALRIKRATATELAAFASVLRDNANILPHP